MEEHQVLAPSQMSSETLTNWLQHLELDPGDRVRLEHAIGERRIDRQRSERRRAAMGEGP